MTSAAPACQLFLGIRTFILWTPGTCQHGYTIPSKGLQPHTYKRSIQNLTQARGPSAGKPGGDRPECVCDVFMGSRTTTMTCISSEQRIERGKNYLCSVPQGLKYLPMQTGPKLRNHTRVAQAMVLTCEVAVWPSFYHRHKGTGFTLSLELLKPWSAENLTIITLHPYLLPKFYRVLGCRQSICFTVQMRICAHDHTIVPPCSHSTQPLRSYIPEHLQRVMINQSCQHG